MPASTAANIAIEFRMFNFYKMTEIYYGTALIIVD